MTISIAKEIVSPDTLTADAHTPKSGLNEQETLLEHSKYTGMETTHKQSSSESDEPRLSKTLIGSDKVSESTDKDPTTLASNHSSYWSSLPPTIDSMLGGFPEISRIDLRGSAVFVAKLFRKHPPKKSTPSPFVGVDCGAGIGRVAAGFLSRICDVVDVVELVESLASAVRKQEMKGNGEIGTVFVEDLKVWEPEMGKYDIIWNQWCTSYLKDKELVEYLKRCAARIKSPDGWIILKENTTRGDYDTYDAVDDSVTRSNYSFLRIFQATGLNILAVEIQRGLPEGLGLYPVRMYALKPLSPR